jgi:ferredoxin--NADP+ reductase
MKSQEIADKIYEIWVKAPHVAHNAQPGQFVIIRISETGERIPLTISRVVGGTIRLIFLAIGKTTRALADIPVTGYIEDIVGPLGQPSEIKAYGTCAIVGGGVGIPSTPYIAKALKQAGNRVIGIIGARNQKLLLLEKEMEKICDSLLISTDDGSKGHHGFAADLLKLLITKEPVHAVWIIGPAIMMKVTAEVTRGQGIKTFVSLNPIMVDGTGMCGACRCTVAGKTKFACVDGPEFDAHTVDFDTLIERQQMYKEFEQESFNAYVAKGEN